MINNLLGYTIHRNPKVRQFVESALFAIFEAFPVSMWSQSTVFIILDYLKAYDLENSYARLLEIVSI